MELQEIEKKVNENIQLKELLEILNQSEGIDIADKVGLIAACAFNNALFEYGDANKLGEALWRAVRYITGIKMPMQMLDFTAMLFPGMDKYFCKIITPTAFCMIQRQAATMLEDKEYQSEEHKEHLEKIVDGRIPYGYSLEMPSIKEEENNEVEKKD